jgi:hypothetical protein
MKINNMKWSRVVVPSAVVVQFPLLSLISVRHGCGPAPLSLQKASIGIPRQTLLPKRIAKIGRIFHGYRVYGTDKKLERTVTQITPPNDVLSATRNEPISMYSRPSIFLDQQMISNGFVIETMAYLLCATAMAGIRELI